MATRDRAAAFYSERLTAAREQAANIARSPAFQEFVEEVRAATPWRFNGGIQPEKFLRGVDGHLQRFAATLLRSVDGEIESFFEFGCGTGSAATALLMVLPDARCDGVDISPKDVVLARARAKLYGVEDRCRFDTIDEGATLAAPAGHYDLCTCWSVLEYAADPAVRTRCVQEMARIIKPGGFLFIGVPNRLYPVESHSRKLGWNWFPKLLKATIVGSNAWEVRKLARPHVLEIHRTPASQLFAPWTNFCLKKAA